MRGGPSGNHTYSTCLPLAVVLACRGHSESTVLLLSRVGNELLQARLGHSMHKKHMDMGF